MRSIETRTVPLEVEHLQPECFVEWNAKTLGTSEMSERCWTLNAEGSNGTVNKY